MEQIQNQTTTEAVEKRYTMAELKALSGFSHAFIYRQIQKGKLPKADKWGRASRWKESDVKAWLSSFKPSETFDPFPFKKAKKSKAKKS